MSLRFLYLQKDAKGESYKAGDRGGLEGPGILYIGYKVISRIILISKLKLGKKNKIKVVFAPRETMKERQMG